MHYRRKANFIQNDDDAIILKPALFHDIPTNKTWNAGDEVTTDTAASEDDGTTSTSTSSSSFVKVVYQSITKFYKSFLSFNTELQPKSEPQSPQSQSPRLGITIVCISDTHGQHRKLTMPDHADILIHAGDYTKYGKKEDAIDFNEWLGLLPYKTKLVVNGNHECNAMWKNSAKSLLSNAQLLIDESVQVEVDVDSDDDDNNNHSVIINENNDNTTHQKVKKKKEKVILNIHGTNFYWPSSTKHNPYFEQIEQEQSTSNTKTDILISHCPALGYVDRDRGCPALLHTIQRIRPMLVISGHEHMARGIVKSDFTSNSSTGIGAVIGTTGDDGNCVGGITSTTFVNAANAKGGTRNGHAVGKEPIILTL